ncbi:MAG: hypothetical protein ONA69_08565, partial [candidate division KSB1 bacterium]|nr:hypothetical protein [candidate division KSB1 bacterium]
MLFLLAGFSAALAATDYSAEPLDLVKEQFSWTSYPELNGKGVNCIAQDREGKIWFGTESGIFSYDGLHWEQFTKRSGLPEGAPTAIK